MIYLDHNATTPIDPRVVEVMMPFFNSFYGNPSSLYRMGRVVRSAVETAREQVAALVDVQPSQIVFTSGGTEANNLALNTSLFAGSCAVSSIEHPSIIEPASKNSQRACRYIAVDSEGRVIQALIDSWSQKQDLPALVSIMLANNETGAIQDIKGIAQTLKNTPTLFHTDAVQGIGKLSVSFHQLGVDLMSLSSHKIYGPKGCGALVIGKEVKVAPILVGGGQENDWRAGTENVPAIIGFGKASELAMAELQQNREHYLMLRNLLEKGLKKIPGLVIFAEQVERLPNTVQFGLPDADGEMLQMLLDKQNIAVSSGSACSSGGGKPSPVLTAMGIDSALAKSAIRISLGKSNTEQEVIQFIDSLKSIVMN